MDFEKSGRIDNFTLYSVNPKNLSKETKMGCSIIGGTLNYGYETDLKVAGIVRIINAKKDLCESEKLVRIYYEPTLDGKTQKICLGTFYYTAELHYENGMYSGQLELKSTLKRYIDDSLSKTWSFPKGATILSCIKKLQRYHGGAVKVICKNAKLKTNKVYCKNTKKTSANQEYGYSVMRVINELCAKAGARATVDAYGRMVIEKYISPKRRAKKEKVAEIETDAKSLLVNGVDKENSIKTIPNRVCASYTYEIIVSEQKQYKDKNTGQTKTKTVKTLKKITVLGKAKLAGVHSKDKIGRWITHYYTINEIAEPKATQIGVGKKYRTKQEYYQKMATKKAKAKLKEVAGEKNKITYYTINTTYQPLKVGDIVKVNYGGKIKFKGFVHDIDLDLSVGLPMTVRVKKV